MQDGPSVGGEIHRCHLMASVQSGVQNEQAGDSPSPLGHKSPCRIVLSLELCMKWDIHRLICQRRMIKIADTLEPGDIRLYLLKLGMFGVVVLGVGQRHNAITRTGSRPIETQTQGEDQNNHFVPDRPEGVTYIHWPEVFLTFPALHSTLQRTQQGKSQSTRQKHLLRAIAAL